MPEERNRYESDHLSTLLFAPTNAAIENLYNEGIGNNHPPYSLNNPGVFHCGDIMFDNTLFFKELSNKKEQLLQDLQLHKSSYILATIHRNFNTDNPDRLLQIFDALRELASERRVVVPLHPRTRKAIENSLSHKQQQQIWNSKITLTEPLSFLEMTLLEAHCSLIITDSGGVQKEAFFFQKPSVILRPETEWIEIVECGAAQLSDANSVKILEDTNTFLRQPPQLFPELFGNGRAAEEICSEILKWHQSH
jgi:UDP-GlcNAc3NAcA epimerase